MIALSLEDRWSLLNIVIDQNDDVEMLANVLDHPTTVKRKRANSDHIDIFLISLLKQTTLIP